MGMQHIQEAELHIMDPRINHACLHAGCGKVGPLVGIEGRGLYACGPSRCGLRPLPGRWTASNAHLTLRVLLVLVVLHLQEGLAAGLVCGPLPLAEP